MATSSTQRRVGKAARRKQGGDRSDREKTPREKITSPSFYFLGTSRTQRRGKAARLEGGGGQAAPPGGKSAPLKEGRRDHHSTELNVTSVNIISTLFFFSFLVFFSIKCYSSSLSLKIPKGEGREHHYELWVVLLSPCTL